MDTASDEVRPSECSIFEPVAGIIGPCERISFSYNGQGGASVRMVFSAVNGLRGEDLYLEFEHVTALRWEPECPGFNPMPLAMPKCSEEAWSRWTFPLLITHRSDWLGRYRQVHEAASNTPVLAHFYLISMWDLVQLIAGTSVQAKWVAG